MRYNKIFAGPVDTLKPQVTEAPVAVDTLPGTFVVESAGTLVKATAASRSVRLLQDNYLTMEGTDTAITAGNVGLALALLPEQLFHARVADAADLSVGTELAINASGVLAAAVAGEFVVATSRETYENTTGGEELVLIQPTSGYLKP